MNEKLALVAEVWLSQVRWGHRSHLGCPIWSNSGSRITI